MYKLLHLKLASNPNFTTGVSVLKDYLVLSQIIFPRAKLHPKLYAELQHVHGDSLAISNFEVDAELSKGFLAFLQSRFQELNGSHDDLFQSVTEVLGITSSTANK
jgi:hypothetical protein